MLAVGCGGGLSVELWTVDCGWGLRSRSWSRSRSRPESIVLTGFGVVVGVGKFSSTPTPTRSRSRLQHFFISSLLVKSRWLVKLETDGNRALRADCRQPR